MIETMLASAYQRCAYLTTTNSLNSLTAHYPNRARRLPALDAISLLLIDCTSEIEMLPQYIRSREEIRDVSLTIAALDRSIAAFALAALMEAADPSNAQDAVQPAVQLDSTSDLASILARLGACRAERLWRVIPSGGVGSLLFTLLDIVEVCHGALRRLNVVTEMADSSTVAWLFASCTVNEPLKLIVAQNALALVFYRLFTLSCDISRQQGCLVVAVAAPTRTLNIPQSPWPRRAKSFVQMLQRAPAPAHASGFIARRLLTTTLLPRSSTSWSTFSDEAARVQREIEAVYAAVVVTQPLWRSPYAIVRAAELPVVLLAAFLFFSLAPSLARRFSDGLVMDRPINMSVISHAWRLADSPLIRAAMWGLHAPRNVAKTSVVLNGVELDVIHAVGFDARAAFADARIAAPDAWPRAVEALRRSTAVGHSPAEPLGLTLASETDESGSVPESNPTLPKTLIFLHGGGYTATAAAPDLRLLADWLSAMVAESVELPIIIYVEYALAPEHVWPTQHNEVVSVYRWARARTASVCVMGESAGATLSASLAVDLALRGEPMPASLELFYPPLTLTLDSSPSRLTHLSDPFVPYPILDSCVRQLLGPAGADADDPVVNPLRASDDLLRRFPCTNFYVGGLDPLLDDSGKRLLSSCGADRRTPLTP